MAPSPQSLPISPSTNSNCLGYGSGVKIFLWSLTSVSEKGADLQH